MSGHEDRDRLVVLPGDHSVLRDENPAEQRLVQLTPNVLVGRHVGIVAAAGRLNGSCDGAFDLLRRVLGPCERCLCGSHGTGDPFLFALKQIQWYGAGVVGLEELGAFVVESQHPLLSPTPLFLDVVLGGGDLVAHRRRSLIETLGGELHEPVVGFDLFFHQRKWPMLQIAGRSFLMPSDAEVVRVDPAVSPP